MPSIFYTDRVTREIDLGKVVLFDMLKQIHLPFETCVDICIAHTLLLEETTGWLKRR